MLKQIRLLSTVQLRNLFGINEIRYTKDKKKKSRFIAMAVLWIMLAAMLLFYTMALSMGLILMGMADIVPAYLSAITGLIILMFTFFKAGSVIFQMNTYEILVSLPVSQAAIVISRFLTMYVTNLILSLMVMVPGMIMYARYMHPAFSFYIYGFAGTILLPLLPISIATAAGAAITALSARMKHKSLVSAFLTIVLVVLIVIGSTILGSMEEIPEELLKNFALIVEEKIGQIYPPAMWLRNAMVGSSARDFLVYAGISIFVFIILVGILQHFFLSICTALNATSAKNNYQMGRLHASSVTAALWKKEVKRYFASSIYVTNIMIGYALMVIMAIALLMTGVEKMETLLGFPGIVTRMLPLLLALVASISPTTACSVSMEGKQWWLLQSLPVRGKDIWDAKILLNLTIALPFYVIAVVVCMLAVRPSLYDAFWLILLPLVYILFTSVVGITVNLAMPVFDWENETRAVKQSASTMVTILVGMLSAILPMVLLFVAGKGPDVYVYGITALILFILTVLLYIRNSRQSVIF